MLVKKIFLAFLLVTSNACVKEPKLAIKEKKILSFYEDYYILKEKNNLLPDSIKKPSIQEIIKFTLKKNKLSEADLKKINEFYYLNPIKHNLILKKIEKRIDILFKEKKK